MLPGQGGKKLPMLMIICISVVLITVALIAAVSSHSKRIGTAEDPGDRAAAVTVAADEKIRMINVVGMKYPVAVDTLASAGFSNIGSSIDPGKDTAEWYVTEQSVKAGSKVKANTRIELTCAVKCRLYLDIRSAANLLFSAYDITISLDDEEIGTVANDKTFTYQTEIMGGRHKLEFCKSGNSSPYCVTNLKVEGDMTFSCDLHHKRNSIEIRNENTSVL